MLHRTCQRNNDEVMNAARSESNDEGEESIYLTFMVTFLVQESWMFHSVSRPQRSGGRGSRSGESVEY